MNSAEEQLAQSLRVKFGTSPYEPNVNQLDLIKIDITELKRRGITPSETDWKRSVSRHCPSAGDHKYAGVDNSDLNTLLALATKPFGK